MNFQPLNDLILVKPETAVHEGLIFVPDTVQGKHARQPGDSDDSFIGVVVATGPGDKLLHAICRACGATKATLAHLGRGFGICKCGGNWWGKPRVTRAPMQTKVGDRVLFARRPNSPGDPGGIEIEGERYLLFNEEQSVLAVVG